MTNYYRPSWDDYFFEVVDSVSKRATCDRGRSGCVIVRNNQILSTGYVGSIPGFQHCDDGGHIFEQRRKIINAVDIKNNQTTMPDKPENFEFDHASMQYIGPVSEHCIRTIHAEQNAICQAARNGVSIINSTIYCRMTPCRTCAMLIISSGIISIKCENKYHAGEESETMFEQAGVKVTFRNNETLNY